MSLVADLVVTHANILTMDDARPSATALAVRRGIVERVGSDADVLPLVGRETTVLDLRGKTVVPGFHDCHLHLLWFGLTLTTQVNLVGAGSIDELLARLSAFAEQTDGWIRGHGFDQDKLLERRFPTRQELDRVSTTRPVIVSRVCGHALVANSAAIRELSADEQSQGNVETGLFTEEAGWTLLRRVPPPDARARERALLAAMDAALRSGITSVQTMLDTPEQMQTYSAMRRRLGRLPLRVVVMPPERCAETLHAHGIVSGFGDDWLRVGGLKFFADGSLGARTALLGSPYADDPSAIGQRTYEPEALKQRCRAVADMGFQLVVHAIGDQALRETLDAIEFALQGQDNQAPRHRVEHASLCPPDLMQRMADRQVVATLQPQFVTSDTWTGERIGPARLGWAYPFRSMIDAGVPCGLGSDCPVEKLDSMQCLSSAVNRHRWSDNDKLTAEQALRAYTVGSAYAGDRERVVGKLSDGFRADFVVLSDDPRQVNPSRLASLTVERVFVDGEPVRP